MLNYIFDLDGTIVNSSKEVLRCFETAFNNAGVSIDKSKLTSDVIGPPLREILLSIKPDLTDEDKIKEIMLNFRNLYDNDENDESVMYKDVFEVLTKLKKSHKKLFIATLKPTIPTMRILKKFKIDNYFTDIYTIDKFGENISKNRMINDIIKNNNLEKSKTVMIGDALSDILAAQQAGISAIGALWGYGDDKNELIKKADRVINSIGELCQK